MVSLRHGTTWYGQALSWLASHRGTLEGQFERTPHVHRLMSSLLGGMDLTAHTTGLDLGWA